MLSFTEDPCWFHVYQKELFVGQNTKKNRPEGKGTGVWNSVIHTKSLIFHWARDKPRQHSMGINWICHSM